jgi:hypothetical protein
VIFCPAAGTSSLTELGMSGSVLSF